MERLQNVGFSPPSANYTLNELSIDPYPFGIDEVFDAYRIIVESKGRAIGMAGEDLNIVLSGDSAYVQRLPLAVACLHNLDVAEVALLRDALLRSSSTIRSCRIPRCRTPNQHPVHRHLFPSLWLSC
jgi:hypothetical protein